MIDCNHDLSMVRQCQILELPRSTAYHVPAPESPEDLALMRRIGELNLQLPFAGARILRDLLPQEGVITGRKPIGRLMEKMGIEALYRKANTSKKAPGATSTRIGCATSQSTCSTRCWAADITYIPMRRGFIHLIAVVNWFSRKVLAWRVSNTLTADFCVDAVKEAIYRHGLPDIFNAKQGSQFTNLDFTTMLKDYGIAISMDGARAAGGATCSSSTWVQRQVRGLNRPGF